MFWTLTHAAGGLLGTLPFWGRTWGQTLVSVSIRRTHTQVRPRVCVRGSLADSSGRPFHLPRQEGAHDR